MDELCTTEQCLVTQTRLQRIEDALWGPNRDNGINGNMKEMRNDMKEGFSKLEQKLECFAKEQSVMWKQQGDANWRQKFVSFAIMMGGGGLGGAVSSFLLKFLSN